MSQPPKEMYEALFELNLKGLLEAINKRDFDRMHRAFNRMTHALEEVEQYKMEEARKELKRAKTSKCKECNDDLPFDSLIWGDKGGNYFVCERCYKEGN
jgi:hypothetical protein